jgi:hypothetical protein
VNGGRAAVSAVARIVAPMLQHHPARTWLRPNIHMAAIGRDIVVLDVDQDTYFCLPEAGDQIAIGDDGALHVQQQDVREELRSLGWTADVPDTFTNREQTSPSPALDLASDGSPKAGDLVRVAIVSFSATLRFRRLAFSDLLSAVSRARRRHHHLAPSKQRLAQTAQAFCIVLPWLPRQGDCLQRAFMLLHCLASEGIHADWVFGVRTWPFAAHCWVQSGATVIGDDLDLVQSFTPILRV